MTNCSALVVSAPASNQGKTTVTSGIAQLYRRNGAKVRVFKTGPDFLDPMILERASGQPVYQLDLWMNGEANCRELLCEAANEADLILIEGVMGLFDGQPSSADLAELFGVPVIAVIDASSMAQTFGAIAAGLAQFRPSLKFAGVLANKVASARHSAMLKEGLPQSIRYLGELFRDSQVAFPSRHLGLVQAEEIDDIDQRLEKVADALENSQVSSIVQQIEFKMVPSSCDVSKLLQGVTIAVAKDRAFSFLYEANLGLLGKMGAQLKYFSPLVDKHLPEADAIYIPGGYPELYLEQLEQNSDMKRSLIAHFELGRCIYAECGGMLYLLDSLTDKDGRTGRMVGLLPGKAVMQARLSSLGYQCAEFPEGILRGHTFHHSQINVEMEQISCGKPISGSARGEGIYRKRGLLASYLHLYFPSNPKAAAAIFRN